MKYEELRKLAGMPLIEEKKVAVTIPQIIAALEEHGTVMYTTADDSHETGELEIDTSNRSGKLKISINGDKIAIDIKIRRYKGKNTLTFSTSDSLKDIVDSIDDEIDTMAHHYHY